MEAGAGEVFKLALREPNTRPELPLWLQHIFVWSALEVFLLVNHYGQQINYR